MHKRRPSFKRAQIEKVDRGPHMEEIEKRGPRTQKEKADLKAWQQKQRPHIRPRNRPYHQKTRKGR